MPRTKAVETEKVTLYIAKPLWDRMVKFTLAKNEGKLLLSAEVQQAIKEYLAKHRREV